MMLSELLNEVEKAYAEHGNLEVKINSYECGTNSVEEAFVVLGAVKGKLFFLLEPK